jgi:ornithine carbamoyltransferase
MKLFPNLNGPVRLSLQKLHRMPKHFLDIDQVSAKDLRAILTKAAAMKKRRKKWPKAKREPNQPLEGKVVALVFERPSTRTRVSFEMAMRQMGGDVVVLNGVEMQMGRGESIADTARVLSRYVDCIMLRAAHHDTLVQLAAAATVPVINGLTDKTHPCQVMADVLTLEEHIGRLDKKTVAWVGDGNNVAKSWVHAVGQLGGTLRLGCPDGFTMDRDAIAWAKNGKGEVVEMSSPTDAVRDVDCVITDAWVSMHDKEGESRHNVMMPYQVNAALMSQAKKDAIFMHCLPAHRNEEVTDEIMDGPHSVVFDEAENRLHIQKAILQYCMSK